MKLEMEFFPRKDLPVAGLVFLAVAAALAALQFARAGQLRADLEQKQNQVARLDHGVQSRARAASVTVAATAEQEQLIKAQKDMLDELRYPWNRLMAEVEQNDRKSVALLSFSHSQASKMTLISVEALSVGELVGYVNALNGDQSEIHWYLASHQLQNQKSPATVKGEIVGR